MSILSCCPLGSPFRLSLLPLLWIAAMTVAGCFPAPADTEPAAASQDAASRSSMAADDSRKASSESSRLPRIAETELGLGGAWKVGHWTPVRVTLEGGSEAVAGTWEIEVPDGDGFLVRYAQEPGGTPFELSANSSITLTGYVKIGRPRSSMEVVVRLAGGERVQHRVAAHELAVPLSATRNWILQVGSTVNLDQVVRRRRSQMADDLFSNSVPQTGSLPSDWFGYEGVDTVLLMTSSEDQLDQFSAGRQVALEQWVKLGGRLIISAGRNGLRIESESGPLARLIPGTVQGVIDQRVAAGLEEFARAQQTLAPFTASRLVEPRGRVEAYLEGRTQARHPAIVRSARGFGQVVFLTFDIDQAPFPEWTATDELLRSVFRSDRLGRESAGRDEGTRRVTHFGYDELAGQLRSALDHFPGTGENSGVRLISFFAVAALLTCYVLAISAGDFFLLERLVGRMTWTWFTFPAIVILFSVAIVVWGQSWRGGNGLRTNQVDIVDLDLVDGTWRGTSWVHLYSPSTRGYDLTVAPVRTGGSLEDAPESFRAIASWQGLPGRGLGGLDQVGGEPQFPVAYSIRGDAPPSPEQLLAGMPITTGATRSLLTRWWSFPQFPAVEPLTADREGFLHGTITNPFDFPIEDALLAYDRWAYRIDRPLEPGETLIVDGLQRRDLEWRLTRRRALHGQTAYASTPWEIDSREVDRIMEMMMFHEAAGGRGYTDMNHRFQQFVDLSGHLLLERAVLVGRAAVPGMQLKTRDESLTDQADRHWSWYRLILPVEHTDRMATERYLP